MEKENIKDENLEEVKEEKVEEVKEEKSELELLKEENAKLQEELANAKNEYFKVFADTQNMRKRLQNDADMARKYRIQSFAQDVLPIIDNLERALNVQVEDEAIANYAKGFEMIYKQLVACLEKEGVKEIEALDKPFDPNVHQALMQEAKEGVESGIVIEVLQKGYMLKDRVLRATLVKVSE